jgi:hypothetical protein
MNDHQVDNESRDWWHGPPLKIPLSLDELRAWHDSLSLEQKARIKERIATRDAEADAERALDQVKAERWIADHPDAVARTQKRHDRQLRAEARWQRRYERLRPLRDAVDEYHRAREIAEDTEEDSNLTEVNHVTEPTADMATLESLTRPGGLIEELVDWIVSSAERPSRPLALAAAITFVGTLMGRRYASPTDLRSNFYVMALAPSAYGKEHARAQLKRLAAKAGLDNLIGPNRFMSASAVRNTLRDQPALCCFIDEFGSLFRQMCDPRAGLHNQLIKSDLLELFSSAATYFTGAAYAGTAAVRIQAPNLSLYGTSTAADFWTAVSSLNTVDGLIARFILFNVDGARPDRVVPARAVDDIPAELIERCRALAFTGWKGGNLSNLNLGSVAPTITKVALDQEAEDVLDDYKTQIDTQMADASDAVAPILGRAVEHAIKLALVAAVATTPEQPLITGQHMRWGRDLATYSARAMVNETHDHIADSDRERNVQRILGHIKKAGSRGMTTGELADRTRSIDRRQRTEILEDLALAGRVREESIGRRDLQGGRPSTRYFVMARVVRKSLTPIRRVIRSVSRRLSVLQKRTTQTNL